ncbi:hypothetical protein [Bailinhaonella thermotolerans]|uniref:SPOR domain-containing protein n=1 Tax=Bailinhaonella thermotolerans TaxID=1070861 RepID=A0A3A4BEV8_9ACTN|nr:hypothetical protein [Bailinhaonella thermotolerans]RJL32860.1 hypothetical protein D5H75_13560 [Bailinhaonella thermotolerans]
MGDVVGDWWYCLRHMRVEHGPGCPNKDRLGPYETEAEAANAMRTAAERNEAWREQDKEWNED